MTLLKYFLVVAGVLFLTSAFAVDGYRDIKFGISYQELVKHKRCTLGPVAVENGIHLARCEDFLFNGEQTMAAFIFVERKLVRIVIYAGNDIDTFNALQDSLLKKYGEPSLLPRKAQFNAYNAGSINQVDINWDKNTVTLRAFREDLTQSIFLLYSVPNYDALALKSRSSGVERDL